MAPDTFCTVLAVDGSATFHRIIQMVPYPHNCNPPCTITIIATSRLRHYENSSPHGCHSLNFKQTVSTRIEMQMWYYIKDSDSYDKSFNKTFLRPNDIIAYAE